MQHGLLNTTKRLWEQLLWEQGLPAMRTPRSLEYRGAWIASKLCSHKSSLPQGCVSPGQTCR
ncbi:protein of unknown function [Pseudomonas mediterranea]